MNSDERSGPNIVTTLRVCDADQIRIYEFNHVNQILHFTISMKGRGSFTKGEKLLQLSIPQGHQLRHRS
jgi:hypothetical protein